MPTSRPPLSITAAKLVSICGAGAPTNTGWLQAAVERAPPAGAQDMYVGSQSLSPARAPLPSSLGSTQLRFVRPPWQPVQMGRVCGML